MTDSNLFSNQTSTREEFDNTYLNTSPEASHATPSKTPKKNVLPVILIIIALFLIIWGIWRLIPKEETVENATIDIEMIDLEKEKLDTASPSTEPVVETNTTPRFTATPTPTPITTNVTTTPTPQAIVSNQNVTPSTTHTTTTTTYVSTTLSTVPKLEICERDGDKWRAKLVLPKVDNAKQYWLTVGTDYNSSNFHDQQYVNSDQQTVWLSIEGNKDYYAKYAVRNCSDCNDNYGNFSATLKFSCSGSSSWEKKDDRYYGDFNGFKCNKDKNQCESTNNSNPAYANSQDGLNKCLDECS